MNLRAVFEQERIKRNVPWEVIEQDYVLSWVLFGVSEIKDLKETLTFKGGTALKKCYFGEYRFSQDLDFSCLEGAPKGKSLEELLIKACKEAEKELNNRFPNPVMTCERYKEKEPHPNLQEAFKIKTRLPWHDNHRVPVKVEVTRNEIIVNESVFRNVMHGYPEDFNCQILTYTMNEIFAEKLRAILQNTKKIHERTAIRSRARDYYDLWRILHTYPEHLNAETITETLIKKCVGKDVDYQNINDFFDQKLLDTVERDWDQWLSPLIRPLPPYEKVISELRQGIQIFLH